MKRSEPMRVDAIIRQALEASGTTETFNAQQASYLWPEIVGPTINRHTTRRWVDRGELHVCITSAALKNELSFVAATLVQRINKAVGADVITKIVFH